jgi:uncharacterized RmlC-like cupin family protein
MMLPRGRLGVRQYLEGEAAGGDLVFEPIGVAHHVVEASLQPAHGRGVIVDPDEKREDAAVLC